MSSGISRHFSSLSLDTKRLDRIPDTQIYGGDNGSDDEIPTANNSPRHDKMSAIQINTPQEVIPKTELRENDPLDTNQRDTLVSGKIRKREGSMTPDEPRSNAPLTSRSKRNRVDGGERRSHLETLAVDYLLVTEGEKNELCFKKSDCKLWKCEGTGNALSSKYLQTIARRVAIMAVLGWPGGGSVLLNPSADGIWVGDIPRGRYTAGEKAVVKVFEGGECVVSFEPKEAENEFRGFQSGDVVIR